MEEFGQAVQHLVEYFYYDYGLRMPTGVVRFKRGFDVLKELFDWFGLQIKSGKTVGMVCHPCCAIGGYSVEAYGRWMIGEGMMHQARQHKRFQCPKCTV